jgi:hypothetical protein
VVSVVEETAGIWELPYMPHPINIFPARKMKN